MTGQKSKIVIGFADTFDTAKRFFTWALSQRFEVEINNETPDYLIFGDHNFGNNHGNIPAKRKIFYTGENIRPTFFDHTHAITFDHIHSPNHYRLPLYVLESHMMIVEQWTEDFLWLQNHKIKNPEEEYNHKIGFCSYVQSNPNCPTRTQFVEQFSRIKKIDCAGPHLNNTGFILPREGVNNKIDFLRKYKFNVCFENGSYPGYVTEKIHNAFYAQTIPIYWGSETIAREFNSKRFINCHEFTDRTGIIDWNAVVKKILSIDQNKLEYIQMLTEPIFLNKSSNENFNLNNFNNWFEQFVLLR